MLKIGVRRVCRGDRVQHRRIELAMDLHLERPCEGRISGSVLEWKTGRFRNLFAINGRKEDVETEVAIFTRLKLREMMVST